MIRAIRSRLSVLGDPERGLFFAVLGYGVKVHPSFWLVALLLGWPRSRDVLDLAAWVAVAFASILVHELGHALTAARWAVVYRISIHGAGGATTWRALREPGLGPRLLVSLAGPAAGLAFALVAHLLLPHASGRAWAALSDLRQVNVAWSLFNLLPVGPLDGGQSLRAVLVRLKGDVGETVAAALGLVVAGTVAVVCIAAGEAGPAVVLAFCALPAAQHLAARWRAWRDAHTHTRWQTASARERASGRF